MRSQKRRQKFWFWAWLAEITVPKATASRRDARGELWENLVLIAAHDATDAFRKATRIGRAGEGDCRGSLTLDRKPAVTIFLGILDMGVVHDALKHGGEILFRESRCRVREVLPRIAQANELLAKLAKELAPLKRLARERE